MVVLLKISIGKKPVYSPDWFFFVIVILQFYVLNCIFKAFTYPNPFELTTTVSYYNPIHSNIYFSVFNLVGEKVLAKNYSDVAKGYQEIIWDGKNKNGEPMPKGTYLFELKSSAGKFNGKVILN